MRRSNPISALLTLLVLLVLSAGLARPAAATPENYFWEESTAGLSVSGSYVPVVGDFAGNGQPFDDILWYAPGAAADYLWQSDGDTGFTKAGLAMAVNGTYEPLVGDFAGDWHEDVFWYAAGPAQDHLWTSDGDGGWSTAGKTVNGTYDPTVLDDAAGKDDIVWTKPGGGPGSVWSFEGNGNYLSTPMNSPLGATAVVGWFGPGLCQDIFWYAPGVAADSLWFMNCAGTAGSVFPQVVNGTFQPVVELFSVVGDDYSDILWFRSNDQSKLWEADGDGTWTMSGHDIPYAGTAIAAGKHYGFAHIWSPNAQDHVFWDQAGHDNYVAPLANTDMGAGYVPLVGDFVGSQSDIFWYKPGNGTERLMYHDL